MKILIIASLVLLCGYLWDYEHRCQDIPTGEAKITVKLVDGKKLYPATTYAKQDHVQLIMTDGRSITMAWAQVEVIVFAGNKE